MPQNLMQPATFVVHSVKYHREEVLHVSPFFIKYLPNGLYTGQGKLKAQTQLYKHTLFLIWCCLHQWGSCIIPILLRILHPGFTPAWSTGKCYVHTRVQRFIAHPRIVWLSLGFFWANLQIWENFLPGIDEKLNLHSSCTICMAVNISWWSYNVIWSCYRFIYISFICQIRWEVEINFKSFLSIPAQNRNIEVLSLGSSKLSFHLSLVATWVCFPYLSGLNKSY